MKKLLLLCILLLCACSSDKDVTINNVNKHKEYGTNEIPEEIQAVIKEDNYVILDVRTNGEYSESHVVDAINIPYDQIDNSINIDKDKVILVYCMSGRRSSIAFDTLTGLGYKVYDLGAFDDIGLEKE